MTIKNINPKKKWGIIMINKDYTFLTKESGPKCFNHEGAFYGDSSLHGTSLDIGQYLQLNLQN